MPKTKTLETKFEEPTRENVKIGDFVVAGRNYGDWHDAPDRFYSILGLGENSVFYKSVNVYECLFDDCFILRNNGTYLIGRNVQRNIVIYEAD